MATHSGILAWRIPMDRGAWRATVPGVAKSQTQLSEHAHMVPGKLRISYDDDDGCYLDIRGIPPNSEVVAPSSYYSGDPSICITSSCVPFCHSCVSQDVLCLVHLSKNENLPFA